MAPIKYEEQMKEKLEKRSLQPSPESWDLLAKRLDAEEKRKNKSLYWWMGIAASFVGILLVTTFYFNSNTVDKTIPTIVDTEENVIQQKENQKIETPIKKEEVAVENVHSIENNLKVKETKANASLIVSKQNKLTNKLPQEEVVAQTDNLSPKESLEKVSVIEKSKLTFEDQKIQDVVAEINALKAKGNTISDSEIDSLLKKAQKEILNNRLYNENTRMVDANALLQDVEEDLQQSFRSKVFEALQSGYESVKTAVAQRNN